MFFFEVGGGMKRGDSCGIISPQRHVEAAWEQKINLLKSDRTRGSVSDRAREAGTFITVYRL